MIAPSQVGQLGAAPAAAPPPQTAPWKAGTARPMSPEDVAKWNERLDRGEAKAKTYHPQWERGLNSYAKALSPKPDGSDLINSLLAYRHVESRKAALHYRTPEIDLIPIEPAAAEIPVGQVLPQREKVLNYELGADGADLRSAMHKTLVDMLAASGWMVVEMGYEQATLPVLDQITGQSIDVPVWARRFISAVSSKKVIIPDDFYDTDFDASPWLAVKGLIPIAVAKRAKWAIPDGFESGTSKREDRYDDGAPESSASEPQLEYRKVYYKASLYDSTVFNPELYRCLVLVKGLETPAYHVDCPYQDLTPEGSLTDDSMRGNPIHMGAGRDLIDSAYVPSDLVVGEQLQDELNKFRTGQVRSRRRRRPVTLVSDKLGQTKIEEIAANAGPVAVPDEFLLDGGQRAILVTQAASEPRDNYTAQQIIEHDWQSAMGTGDNSAGQTNKKATTATEVRTVQANSSARAKMDEDRIRAYVVKLIRKFDTIVQRTATPQEIAKILGPQASALWMQWKLLPGRYAYKIQPDAGRYVDASEYRAQKVNEYNLLRKDPAINATELNTQVLNALGYDAAKLVVPEQGPKPEPPKISISFNAEAAMSIPAETQLLLSLLAQNGYEIPPELVSMLDAQAKLRAAVQALEPPPGAEHGGMADKTEPISKHQTERTGGVQGVGRTM